MKKLVSIIALFMIIQQSFAQAPLKTKDTITYRPINKTCSNFNYYFKPIDFNSNVYNYFYYNRIATLTNPQPFTVNFRIRNRFK